MAALHLSPDRSRVGSVVLDDVGAALGPTADRDVTPDRFDTLWRVPVADRRRLTSHVRTR